MLYKIILKVRMFHQPTASRFSTARQKPVVGAQSLQAERVKAVMPGDFHGRSLQVEILLHLLKKMNGLGSEKGFI